MIRTTALINRTTLFAYVRKAPFGGRLTQQQVDGLNLLLDHWERSGLADNRWLAYILATVFHETAATMQPIRERGGEKYLKAKRYWPYYGRGHVQLTWERNYRAMGALLGLDLVSHPDLALRPDVSVKVLFEGMTRGASGKGDFTGKSLEDYFNATTDDPVGARRIVNGTDKAELIAGYHRNFLDAIEHATATVIPADVTEAAAEPDKPPLAKDRTSWGAWLMGSGGLVGSVLGAINNPYALAAVVIVVGLGAWLFLSGRLKLRKESGA